MLLESFACVILSSQFLNAKADIHVHIIIYSLTTRTITTTNVVNEQIRFLIISACYLRFAIAIAVIVVSPVDACRWCGRSRDMPLSQRLYTQNMNTIVHCVLPNECVSIRAANRKTWRVVLRFMHIGRHERWR